MQEEIILSTSKKQELADITDKVNGIIKKSKVKNGICSVFAAHATAAIIINENYDPNICLDLLDALNKLIPAGVWRHDRIDGNADAHIKSAILGPSETIPIKNGELDLGRWQSCMFVELDGPRSNRKIIVTILGDKD
ncbi:secondary thiamine-phosphate synthase enzyme YjbQ [Candidatus Woesearchaeota archaeon]|nr:secondary thiamine-phosphate synthase enzyme YjbQ [Candidatus Woesearchaeota archaeon]